MRSVSVLTKIGTQAPAISSIITNKDAGHWMAGAGMSMVEQIDGVPDDVSDDDVLALLGETLRPLTGRRVYNYSELGIGKVIHV